MLFLTFTVVAISALSLVSASPIHKRYSAAKIQSGADNLCLAPFSAWQNGTLVGTTGCDNAATWDINPGSGSIILHGTTWALQAQGGGNTNNAAVVLWKSQPGLFAQTWYLTGDNRIAITNGVQCLDESTNGPQTYQCTTGNTNQIWIIIPSSTTPPPNHTIGRVAERAPKATAA
ncbi:uncharacterized protein I206_102145 [Kwoniella pini CBS 10737]|uniref:Ricin B lectin domain-containing protein n=1 Tax=Kwoniella pini CBS 10737 TaxID=1296096 RepID=A0A1B9HUP1_9TREE|nr:uncharacterized protein I206_06761 [Kwoniella pini CBS 10737]OCF46987.1 hypothetical protein I206_06761 [Kwoniella pini CBS 10737]